MPFCFTVECLIVFRKTYPAMQIPLLTSLWMWGWRRCELFPNSPFDCDLTSNCEGRCHVHVCRDLECYKGAEE
jgi:hypothetical protein